MSSAAPQGRRVRLPGAPLQHGPWASKTWAVQLLQRDRTFRQAGLH
jgi:hypothetical protein